MTVFLTADTHWGHKNIIRLAKRPFASLEDMDQALIENWNSTVSVDDVVYHLGDAAYRQKSGTFSKIFSQLNGIKHLIIGNHDNDEVTSQPWASVSLVSEIILGSEKVVLSHYPMRSWNGMYRGIVHFYGHEHGNIQDWSNTLDVGVDNWDYKPVSFLQIKERMATLTPWTAKPKT